MGASVTWYLGKSANTETNRRWAEERLGVVGILDVVT